MTRLDATALPLLAFSSVADLSPFTALAPDKAILAQKNTRESYGAERSRRMNFAIADDAPDDVLNEILWRSIKGAHAALPPIRRGALSR